MNQDSPFSIAVRHQVAFLATVIVLMLQVGSGQVRALDSSQAAPLQVRKIAEGVYVSFGEVALMSPRNRGNIANLGFVIGNESVAVIDTGGSRKTGDRLRAAIRKVTGLPIRYVINTHMHPDHIFGNAAFESDGPVFIGHHKMRRAVERRAAHYLERNRELLGDAAFRGTKVILPTKLVRDELSLDLGGRALLLKAHTTAHTDNDLTVLDMRSKTLWLGDLLFIRHIPVIDGSLLGWLKVLDGLRKTEAGFIVPGHGPMSRSLGDALKPQLRYLRRLVKQIRASISKGQDLAAATEAITVAEAEKWMLIGEFHPRNIAAGYTELEWE